MATESRPLPEYRQRLQRAWDKLQPLASDLHMWLDRYMPLPEETQDPNTGLNRVTLKLDAPIPDEFSLVVGEVLYGLRSSLDHLAYQLTVAYSGYPFPTRVKEEKIEFPIYGKRPPTRNEWSIKIGGINPEAQTLIEGLQPYRKPHYPSEPLWVLQELWNIDKHRRPALCAATIDRLKISAQDEGNPLTYLTPPQGGKIQYGTAHELAAYRTERPEEKVNVGFGFEYYIGFDEAVVPWSENVPHILWALAATVAETIDQLEPFLGLLAMP